MGSFLDAIRGKFARVEHREEEMHGYQLDKAVPFLLANPFSALFIDLGLGKTIISLTAIMRLVTAMQLDKVLVIGPRKVVNETWPTEIELWEHTAPLSYAHIRDDELVEAVNKAGQVERSIIKSEIIGGIDSLRGHHRIYFQLLRAIRYRRAAEYLKSESATHRIAVARNAAAKKAVRELMKRSPATVYLISRDNVEQLVDAFGRDWPFKTVFIDESSSFKDHKCGRFKALRKVRPLITRLHELTATPAAETYLHLFAQIYLLDEGERLGKNYTAYCARYFTQNRYTFKWAIRPGAEEEIAEKISDITLVMKAEDYLPPMIPNMITDTVIMSPSELALYKQMEVDFLVDLPDGKQVEAETAAARSQKLLQIASGVLYETVMTPDEFGELTKNRIVHAVHDHKIEKLENIVEESLGEPILVAYTLKSSLARLKAAFPKAVVMDKDGKCVKDWNAHKIPMLLISPQSAGHGLNLQYGGRRLVFFDIPWSLELYKQTIGRLKRQGQKFIVMVHHIVTRDTIDYDVVQCLQDKDANQEKLFALIKLFRRKVTRRANIDAMHL